MFRFGSQTALFALLLLPLLGVFLVYAWRSRRSALERFGDHHLVRRLSQAVSVRARIVKAGLMVLAVAMLVMALARPQFGTRVETVQRQGQDVLIALDVSASMLAEDIAPNRLEKAKHAIGSLIQRLDGDRVGLVAFAGDAFVQAPLTVDYGAATMFLNAMEPSLIPIPGTDLGYALEVALDAFNQDVPQHRVLVVITDGEDHEGEIARQVERATEEGVRIFTVGIGSPEGVPIPEFTAAGVRRGFKRDENGDVVTTRLDEATLESIARQTDGRYFRATPGESELDLLADEIAGMEGRELDAQQITQFEERFQIFLGLALALLVVEILVPEQRRVQTEWTGRFS